MGSTVGEIPEAAALARRRAGASRPRGGRAAAAETPQHDAAADPDAPVRIGTYLKRQRKLRGISLDELAGLTRIPRRSLERLEAGAWDETPDGFVRGFVRTVGAALGLDPDETVARMLPEARAGGATRRIGLRAIRAALLALLVVGAAIAAVPFLSRRIATSVAAAAPPATPIVLHRRDAVRALAESVGVVPGREAPPER
jgi:transcriptional regulator with XRE-family HTH domain